ncbi:MAG: ABC transporter ATP-binding protein, partial [Rikenellaceae bacterium]
PYNLLILDEPTNHMDMRSKDILKDALIKFDGTVIIVSHDREFLDGMVDRVYEFRDGGVKEYLGGIYYFLEKRKIESIQDIERKDVPTSKATTTSTPATGKLSYEQRKDLDRQIRKATKAVEAVEAETAEVESQLKTLDERMATNYNEEDYKSYSQLKERYEKLMHEWEKLSYEVEILEEQR